MLALSVTREFVLFSVAFIILASILVYSPYTVRQVIIDELIPIAENIMENTDRNYDQITENTNRNYDEIINFENLTESQRTNRSGEIISLALLFLMDIEDYIKKTHNISGSENDRIEINGSHVILDGNRTIELPSYISLLKIPTIATNST